MKLGYKKTPDAITIGELNPNYVVSEILDNNLFNDISTISGWWNSDVLDWGRRRMMIKPLFYAKAGMDLSNYGTLTDEEKLIGASCFFTPYNLRTAIWTEQYDKIAWKALLEQTMISRKATIEAMRKHIADAIRLRALTLVQTQLFDKDTSDMIAWYERSDAQDFKQWLTNEVGSVYENDGFAQKVYYTLALKQELQTIYNGNGFRDVEIN